MLNFSNHECMMLLFNAPYYDIITDMAGLAGGQMTLFVPPSQEVLPGVALQPREILDQEQAHTRLELEIAEARRNGTPLSVITADINALKAVNDEIGHDEGDNLIDLIKSSIGVVLSSLRTEDIHNKRPADIVSVSEIDYSPFEGLQGISKGSTAGRVGGDEFLIILPETDEAGAKAVAKRLYEEFGIHTQGPGGDKFRERGINVGLAVGTGTLQPDMADGSDLLRVSDKDMYDHKLSQVTPLTQAQIGHLMVSLAHLNQANIRPRDLPRYIEWLTAQGLLEGEVELGLTIPGIPQEVVSAAG